ncbi:hypothetical protein [Thetidibacter halocola]|uniref:Uncharacterized protein n=1 Tax=Thetidibacter halocola TaxID=2827239 RepID=A0A8J7WC26_9RHOB|nr:hypothetical protein [Thetidibacter halocola]MBS0122946.1 hypothetical protein [Thetidibacter halocola]
MKPIRTAVAALAGLVALAAPARAQEDPMALQRCVWSCLYGPGKNDPASPAYSACVAQRCTGESAATTPAPPADPTQGWAASRTGAGVGYAGVDGVPGQTGLYYFCGQGQSFLRVIGIDGGERGMIVEIDGRQFPLTFRPNSSNVPESHLPYTAPVIQALQSGSRVRVLSYEAGVVVDATLAGSRRALAQVISSC